MNRIFGTFLFLSLYTVAIAAIHLPSVQIAQNTQNSFQKKQAQFSAIANESGYSSVELPNENVQNTFLTAYKKLVHEHLLSLRTAFSQENAKFKQYRASWYNQLISSRNTDQLYPDHTFG